LSRLHSPQNPNFQNRNLDISRDTSGLDEVFYSKIYEDAQSVLVAPAAVLRRYHQAYNDQRNEIWNDLEEESQIMVESAANNTKFLEYQLRENPSLREKTDFSSGASGLWRTLENEINFSIIQAVRSARTFSMPEHYVLFVKDFLKDKCKVQTGVNKKGEPRFTNINGHDDKHPLSVRHKFLMLGEAYHVVKTMHGDDKENLDPVIRGCRVADHFVDCFLADLEPILEIRNPVSHNRPLTYSDYQRIWDWIIGHGLLVDLMRIKKTMKLP